MCSGSPTRGTSSESRPRSSARWARESRIRAVAPPVVIATTLAAWRGRGAGDVLTSLDVHDIVVLIDGRPELVDELAAEPAELQAYVATELALLRGLAFFEYVVQAAVAGYGEVANERAAIVSERLEAIIARLGPA